MARTRRNGILAALLAGALLASGAVRAGIASVPEETLVVAAAASTLAPLTEAIRSYERTLPTAAPKRLEIVPVFASSGALARQIIAGGPARLFISADAGWMDAVAGAGLVHPETRKVFAANALVLAVPAGSTLEVRLVPGADLAGALGGGRLATADPAHAPLGVHARAALRWLGAWKALAPRLLRAGDAAQARVLVERGAAAAGILYASDAAGNPRLRVVATFPAESHSPSTYEIAVVGLPPPLGDPSPARAFADWLTGPAGREIFRAHGFTPAGEGR